MPLIDMLFLAALNLATRSRSGRSSRPGTGVDSNMFMVVLTRHLIKAEVPASSSSTSSSPSPKVNIGATLVLEWLQDGSFRIINCCDIEVASD
ncbi:hypothetical protein KC330_g140 [Hortaea werneckii]|nr:hypothetical protein KC330_g140 [Hortaea werneckii]